MDPFRRWFRGGRPPRPGRRRNGLRPGHRGAGVARRPLLGLRATPGRTRSSSRSASCPTARTSGAAYTSNLFSTFNSNSSLAGKWQNVILQAAQVWAQQTNINFAVVPDDGRRRARGVDEQGDPEFGDIRIGGYNFGCSTLALTYQPPPVNNFSIAGDMTFNTGQAFNIGSTYDLFTVAMHEFGHALGLNESSVAGAVMYGTYTGRRRAWPATTSRASAASTAATRAHADAYNTNGASNGSLATAASITSLISTSTLTALVPNLDITTAGQSEYFSFTAPGGDGEHAEARRPEQRPEPAGAQGDGLQLERHDRAGHRQRRGPVRARR